VVNLEFEAEKEMGKVEELESLIQQGLSVR